MVKIEIQNNSDIRARASGENSVYLVYSEEYIPGDSVHIECDPSTPILLSIDDTIGDVYVFPKTGFFDFPIPFGENAKGYSPRAFTKKDHLLSLRYANREEISRRRNLAFNGLDHHKNDSLFPHASANVETRDESVFAARCAIDGLHAGAGHGQWPYLSWGINQNPDAELLVSFGRQVQLDEIVIVLRSDFPHDSWWEQATLTFSDSSERIVPLRKTGEAQHFPLEARIVEWVKLSQLKRADDPSPFPALRQLECWGIEQNHSS
jgi:hypothetical protein